MLNILSYITNSENIVSRIILCVTYILVYDLVYEKFIYGIFGYMGDVEYAFLPLALYILWLTLSILPICFYRKADNISNFLCLFLFLLVYIPFVHALFRMESVSLWQIIGYSGTLCVFFSFYFYMGNTKLITNIEILPQIPFKYIEYFAVLLTIVFLITNIGNLHFVNFFTQPDLLYDLRDENSTNTSSMTAYLKGTLFGGFYPFLLINYLNKYKWKYIVAVGGGYLILYMVDMQKLTFFMPFVLIGFYFLFKQKNQLVSQRLYAILIIGISTVSFLFCFVDNDDKILFGIAAIIILRTLCVTGWLTQMYAIFFLDHPYTYYSHINVINLITGAYPYNEPLGVAVSNGGMNANATFFLTDGLAAYGVVGIIIIGVIFFIFIQLVKAITHHYNNADIYTVFLPSLSVLMNVSLFTTLLSNGLFVLLCLIAISAPPSKNLHKPTGSTASI